MRTLSDMGRTVLLALVFTVALASPVVAQPQTATDVEGPRDAEGRLLGPDGHPLPDEIVDGLLDTRDAVIDGNSEELARLTRLRDLSRGEKASRIFSLYQRLWTVRDLDPPSVLDQVFVETITGPGRPPLLGPIGLDYPELWVRIGEGTFTEGTPLWEALLDPVLRERLFDPELTFTEHQQILIDLYNEYLDAGLEQREARIAEMEGLVRLQDLWQFGDAQHEEARQRLTGDAAARAEAAGREYAERQAPIEFNRELDRRLEREARRVTGPTDDAGRIVDDNGEAVSRTTIKGLILIRNQVADQLRAFAAHLESLRNASRSTKLEYALDLRESAREVRDAYVNMEAASVYATTLRYDAGGRPVGYPKTEYDNLLRDADAADRRGATAEAERLRNEAASSLYGTYRRRAIEFFSLLDAHPELAIKVDDVPLWEALLDDDFYRQIAGQTGLRRIERQQLLVDLLNVYLDEGARAASAEAAVVASQRTLEELWQYGEERYTNAQTIAGQLGAQFGATLPLHLVEEVRSVHKGYRITREADNAFTDLVIDLSLGVVAAGLVFVPVSAPLVALGFVAIEASIDGGVLYVRYLEEAEITEDALKTGHIHILSAEERRLAAEQQLIFTVAVGTIGLTLETLADVRVVRPNTDAPPLRPRTGPGELDAPPIRIEAPDPAPDGRGLPADETQVFEIEVPPRAAETDAQAGDNAAEVARAGDEGQWLTPDGRPPTISDLRREAARLSYEALEKAKRTALDAGVDPDVVDRITDGLDASDDLGSRLATHELEERTLEALGYDIVDGVPPDLDELAGIYTRSKDGGGLSPEDYATLRERVEADPDYLETLDRRAYRRTVDGDQIGEHDIVMPESAADEVRDWYAEAQAKYGPPEPSGAPPVVRDANRTDEVALRPDEDPPTRIGDDDEADVPQAVTGDRGPGDTQAVSEAEILEAAPDEETVRLPRRALDEEPNVPQAVTGERGPGDTQAVSEAEILEAAPDEETVRLPRRALDDEADASDAARIDQGRNEVDAADEIEVLEGGSPEEAAAGRRLQRQLDEYYGGHPYDPLHQTSGERLLEIMRTGVLRNEAGKPNFGHGGSVGLVRQGGGAIRIRGGGRNPNIDWNTTPNGRIARYWPEGIGNGQFTVDIPTSELEYFSPAAGRFLEFPPPRDPSSRTALPAALGAGAAVAAPVVAEAAEGDPGDDPPGTPADDPPGIPTDPPGNPPGDPPGPEGAGEDREDPVSLTPAPAGEGVTEGDPIQYAKAIPPIQFPISPTDSPCEPPDENEDVFVNFVNLTDVPQDFVNSPITHTAGRDVTVQLVFMIGPGFDVPPTVTETGSIEGWEYPGGAFLLDERNGEVHVYLTSRGTLGSGAIEMHVLNEGATLVRMPAEGVVLEPIDLSPSARVTFSKDLHAFQERNPEVITADGFCLNIDLKVPEAGTVFRIAGREHQERFKPVRRILEASRRVQAEGRLNPDSDPSGYFQSIRQWAIWTSLEGLNEVSFGEAFLGHTRERFEQAGLDWTDEQEATVRGLLPNRWQDIEEVLEEVEENP